MNRILVPYHLDEHLAGLDIPSAPSTVVTAELPDGSIWERLTVLYDHVAETVGTIVAGGGRPEVYSGDCTTSLGVVAGLQRAGIAPAIVWFDAHGDVQTVETTASGYIGGMPLRVLTGYRPELIATGLGLRPVPETDVLLVDARDLDPPEAAYLESSAITVRPVSEIAAGVLPDGPIYLHLDLDVASPDDVPGLRFPVPGGPSLAEVMGAAAAIVATGRVVAVGIACTWYPGHRSAEILRPFTDDLLGA
ncbi:arginase [Allocatelliglobosispora scoriae]|uniref:Arginase n=1 Tax=Allocatelliglobosispora scoriae TaxID=643052 RepID=A0A841C4A6_9ACTN|nr:arginase family protein [Allocatelliglobosispora scoriae]MBB5873973.1 arginase [Allocatelliglobosispora scoriae]